MAWCWFNATESKPHNVNCYCKKILINNKNVFKTNKKMKEETKKNPNEVANEIFTQHLEGKSYGFVKHVLDIMNNHLDIICTVPTLPK